MISTLTGKYISDTDIKSKWKFSKPYVTGYDIFCSEVHNVAYGQVVYIGYEPDGTFTVNVKSNSGEILRYGNLRKVNIRTGQYAKEGESIGNVKEYVHFEYCTRWQGTSIFPVRVNSYCYYKQDPVDILEGTYVVFPGKELEASPTPKPTKVEYISEDQQKEFNS